MYSYFDHLNDALQNHQQIVQRIKKDLKNPVPEYFLIWEIGELWESLNDSFHASCLFRQELDLSSPFKLSLDFFESFFDEVETILNAQNFFLDEGYDSHRTNRQSYRFEKIPYYKNQLFLTFYLSSCQKVPTGRRIPEMVEDCNILSSQG